MTNLGMMKSSWLNENGNDLKESDRIPLSSLSELTGFPIDFIKKELLLKEDALSMIDLRTSMINYLESASLAVVE